jgi:pyoverdine/dityrosine biosynthesis protein Dit1
MSVKKQKTVVPPAQPLTLFECKSRFGSISIRQIDNIVITEFSGPCGLELVKKYTKALHGIVEQLEITAWGYLSISEDFEAFTDEALVELAYSFAHCQQAGCVADAYVLPSIFGQNQIKKIRDKFGTHMPFEQVLFQTFEHAVNYLRKQVSDIEKDLI